jgi:hypothetical protein
MKTKIVFMISFIIFAVGAVSAQGGFQRRTVEERLQIINQKLDSAFKLDKAKLADADSAFANYYRGTDKLRDDMMAGGQFDRQAFMDKVQPLTDARDKKLQGILTADQYKTWKEAIEPSLRQRRPGGGGNR